MPDGRTLLLIDDDPFFLRFAGDLLRQGGFAVVPLDEPTRAVASALELEPDLIVVDQHMPVLTGGELVLSLRSFPQLADVPVVFAIGDVSERAALKALLSGAADVLRKPFRPEYVERLRAVQAECEERRALLPDERKVENLLSFHARERFTGVIAVNPDMPFEGRAELRQGRLVEARYGPVTGRDALLEMVQLDDGDWRFESGERPQVRSAPVSVKPKTARVLFADDDGATRPMVRRQLEDAGYQVTLAEDGVDAFERAVAERFDVAVIDLNMPRLDGWGLLRLLRSDHRTRDTMAVVLSAQSAYRESLRAVRAGAYDYVAKTGRAEPLVECLERALGPRRAARVDLAEKDRVFLDVGRLGPSWLLLTLGELEATGTLEVRDDWAGYVVELESGELVRAQAVAAKRQTSGIPAIGALLSGRNARGTFIRTAPTERTPCMSAQAAVGQAAERLNQLEATVTEKKLASAQTVDFDPELYRLYLQVATDRDVLVARAVCEQRLPLASLGEKLGLPDEQVERALKDLLRRRVISFGDAFTG